jgi:SAM-dependent methyltransferase
MQKLLKAHLPVRPDWSVIEIGCAPGSNLVDLHRMFGYEPYGIEYTHSGVTATLETFRGHGFNTTNVIEADFFDQEFHKRFRGSFDVVFSGGFIEHFDPPDEVLNLHVNLLKTGGYLVCVIPNLRGLFYPFLWLCGRDLLKAHNCSIMQKAAFRRIFEPLELDVKFSGYVGAFQFYGSSLRNEASLRGVAASLLNRVQDILDLCMFLFRRGSFPESRLSASLVFVGQRIS